MRDKIHSIMDFEFRMDKIQNMHFHQTPEIVYVLDGAVEVEVEREQEAFSQTGGRRASPGTVLY